MGVSSPSTANITELLHRAVEGNEEAQEKLFETVYQELRRIARRAMRNERPDHTLQPTALVHEAFIRLVGNSVPWNSRAHFFGVAGTTMRRILIDHARSLRTRKREGGQRIDFSSLPVLSSERSWELLALDEALERLQLNHARACKVVELQYFVGLQPNEIAEILNVSVKTIRRDWNFARAWLNAELAASDEEAGLGEC